MPLQLILGLLQAAATALSAPGISNARIASIAQLVSHGTTLASVATTASTRFVSALQDLTAQINTMHAEGRDDLTDAEQAAIDAKVEAAHLEIATA